MDGMQQADHPARLADLSLCSAFADHSFRDIVIRNRTERGGAARCKQAFLSALARGLLPAPQLRSFRRHLDIEAEPVGPLVGPLGRLKVPEFEIGKRHRAVLRAWPRGMQRGSGRISGGKVVGWLGACARYAPESASESIWLCPDVAGFPGTD